MATFNVELGIDGNAVVNSGSAFLPSGFVDSSGNVFSNMDTQLNTGDTLQFFIFDITSTAMNPEPTVTLTVAATPADNGASNSNSPFSTASPAVTGSSQVSQFFLNNPPCLGTASVTIAPQLSTAASYLATFTVGATAGPANTPGTFTSDPEMVVGPNGTGNPVDPPFAHLPAEGASATSMR